MTRPVMPSELADVPAWLRHQARRWSLRILFLADELETELDRRQALHDAAAEVGVRIVDLPRGLTEAELHDFMAREIAATPPNPAAEAAHVPAATDAGNLLGQVVNSALAPEGTLLAAVRAGVGFHYWCVTCSAPFGSLQGLAEHARLNRDHITRQS
jgi:hypothetical protein